MKKYLTPLLIALFASTAYYGSAIAEINAVNDDLNVREIATQKHRLYTNGMKIEGTQSFIGGAHKIKFNDVVKFKNTFYKYLNFQANDFEGTGIINAENIKIVANSFTFTGTLQYTESCTIVTATAIDRTSLKFEGPNTPVFIVDPNLPKIKEGFRFAHFFEQGGYMLGQKE